MNIIRNFKGHYQFDPIQHWEIDSISKIENGKTLMYGMGNFPDRNSPKPLYFIDFEIPIFPPHDNNLLKWGEYCDRIITMCPYTTNWYNEMHNCQKAVCSYFPLNSNFIYDNKNNDKLFDVAYTGQAISEEVSNIIRTINKFKHCWVAFGGNNEFQPTHPNVNYRQKMRLISESKISIIHNLVWSDGNWARNKITSLPNYRRNEAYKRIDFDGLLPQVKSRLFEAAFSKSLMLVRKDDWNVVENYFTPDLDFIYYDKDKLEEKIREILENYDSYNDMIISAYNKAMTSFTVDNFINDFLIN